jgi:hypothetical protein
MAELALGTELNVEQREYLELVKASAEALLGVINDLLARIIHQPEKLTREGTFGQDDPHNNRLSGSSRSSTKLIRWAWYGTNQSHGRNRAVSRHHAADQPPGA